MWNPSSLTRDRTHTPLHWKVKSQLLDPQGSPQSLTFPFPCTFQCLLLPSMATVGKNLWFSMILCPLLEVQTS